jgi:phosphate transport system protein
MAQETSLQHTVRSYDDELKNLKQTVARMGALVEDQLQSAIQALVRRDSEIGHRVLQADARIDELEHQVSALAVRVLALRQPVAQDLRDVVAALKISSDLERIGDYAANIGKRVIALVQAAPFRLPAGVPRMGWLAQKIVKDVLGAYIERDPEKALAAWQSDEEVDATYSGLFRELLTHMMEDPRSIGACTHMLFIAKNIERVGDHATNIAETVYYMVVGEPLDAVRPKSDSTSLLTLPPPERA